MPDERSLRRLPGAGWLVLIGGGEFSFGETADADRAWIEKAGPGAIGFVPAASGSDDYGRHFTSYAREAFDREVATVPIYRPRDARRGKNCERLAAAAAVYVGGGIADQLLETLWETPALETLGTVLRDGGVVVGIAAAAQAFAASCRSLRGDERLDGFGWLPGAVVEANFDPGHDRRLRAMMEWPGVRVGLGLPASSAVLLGPEDQIEWVGPAFLLSDADADLEVVGAA